MLRITIITVIDLLCAPITNNIIYESNIFYVVCWYMLCYYYLVLVSFKHTSHIVCHFM